MISGCSAVFESKFRTYSKKVYLQHPTQKEIDGFVEKCCDSSYFDYLDRNKPYEVKELELNLIEGDGELEEIPTILTSRTLRP